MVRLHAKTLLFSLLVCGWLPAAEDRPLNLLIIQTDEHNFRTLGCYRRLLPREQAQMWGPAVVETPQLDWIAAQGATCTSFYATTPVCSPSRAALVTGRYPQATPVTTNNIPLADEMVTFAHILAEQGYATGFAGKWHLDGDGKPQWAPQRKFGFADNRFMFNRGHWKQLELTSGGPRVATRNNRGVPNYDIAGANRENFTTDFLTDRTIEFVRAQRDKPFCFWLSLPDPHGPDTVRPPYDTMYAEQTYEKPRTFDSQLKQAPAWAPPARQPGFSQAKYYGMVKCIDDNVGRLLTTLRELDLLERTVVVFTSDHGDLRGEHHRQNKGLPYEASARIPFLMYAPGLVPPGTVINEALGCVDFQPTVLRLLGQQPCGREQGRDASTLFRTGKAPADWEDLAFIRGTGRERGWLAAVSDRYKLIFSPVEMPYLFDLERDPDEVTNFFTHAGYREVVQRMSAALDRYARQFDDPFTGNERVASDLEWAIRGTGAYPGFNRSGGPQP